MHALIRNVNVLRASTQISVSLSVCLWKLLEAYVFLAMVLDLFHKRTKTSIIMAAATKWHLYNVKAPAGEEEPISDIQRLLVVSPNYFLFIRLSFADRIFHGVASG
jgi:hypothetical protein